MQEGNYSVTKQGPPKNTNPKPGFEIRLETQIKKSMTTSKNDKTDKKRMNMLGQKGKSSTSKTDN